jgi:hypothetical protein
MIDRNKAINKNIEKLLSPDFESRFKGVLEDDNGKIQSFADMKYNQAGELEFNGENLETVRFYVDATHIFKKNILNYLFPGKNKWNIDEVYFIGRGDVNPEIKDIMNKAKEYVNSLSKKERSKYSQERR